MDEPALTASDLFLAVWFFVLGSVIGSFLNVVIYRLPRGESLVHPGSRCPACGKAIRWSDNLPIVGWLILRGRCRNCDAAIPRRYPLVEFTVAVVFLVLGLMEGLGHAANLPGGTNLVDAGWRSHGDLAVIFTYHAVMMCGLIAMSWIVYDGALPPRRLVSFMIGLGLAVPTVLPFVRPVGFDGQLNLPADPPWWQGLVDGGLGIACGASVAALWYAANSSQSQSQRLGVAFAVCCIGCFLGWQTTLGVVVLALILEAARFGWRRLAARNGDGPQWPSSASVTLAAFLWLSTWRWIAEALS